MGRDIIIMSQVQLNRYEVIRRANDGLLTVAEAAESLGLSGRQIQRLKRKVAEEGAAAFIHGNSGRTPKSALPQVTKEKILEIKQSQPYKDANFRHFQELLSVHHKIDISYSTLYNLLKAAEVKSPKTRRKSKPHRRRKRKAQAGLMVQLDATPYRWFQKDKKYYSLHGCIDDATGQITGLYMTKNECLLGYFETMRRTIHSFGIPVSAYADRHTIFQSPNKKKAEIDPSININDTQFGRCLKELGINLIAAKSPQAKGRVERLWDTLQSRLPVEFAVHGITTLEAANKFLETYIYEFNSQFAVEPANRESMFAKPEGMNLDYILCIKISRIIDGGGMVSVNGKSYKVLETPDTGIIPPKAKVDVLLSTEFGIKIAYRNTVFDALPFVPPKRKKDTRPETAQVPRPAPASHPWREGKQTPYLGECHDEILAMLRETFLGDPWQLPKRYGMG